MNDQLISSVITRCKIASIKATFEKWGRFSESQMKRLLDSTSSSAAGKSPFRSKKKRVMEVAKRFVQKNGLTPEILGDLELAYVQLHPKSRVWNVYKLDGQGLALDTDPRTLRSRFVRLLQRRWRDSRVSGNMSIYAGAVWLRAHLASPLQGNTGKLKTYSPANSVFVVVLPRSPYVIVSRTRITLTKILMEAIPQMFNAKKLKDIQLSGRHVASLADLILNKDNMIFSETYRNREEKENPFHLETGCSRKRKVTDTFDESSKMQGVVDENTGEKRRRQEHIVQTFGSGSQPTLETLDYKFKVNFHGVTMDNPECLTHIELKGSSVLSGLVQLAKTGYLKAPIPKHISSIISDARNSFSIGKK